MGRWSETRRKRARQNANKLPIVYRDNVTHNRANLKRPTLTLLSYEYIYIHIYRHPSIAYHTTCSVAHKIEFPPRLRSDHPNHPHLSLCLSSSFPSRVGPQKNAVFFFLGWPGGMVFFFKTNKHHSFDAFKGGKKKKNSQPTRELLAIPSQVLAPPPPTLLLSPSLTRTHARTLRTTIHPVEVGRTGPRVRLSDQFFFPSFHRNHIARSRP